jgi:hypothetical protein
LLYVEIWPRFAPLERAGEVRYHRQNLAAIGDFGTFRLFLGRMKAITRKASAKLGHAMPSPRSVILFSRLWRYTQKDKGLPSPMENSAGPFFGCKGRLPQAKVPAVPGLPAAGTALCVKAAGYLSLVGRKGLVH